MCVYLPVIQNTCEGKLLSRTASLNTIVPLEMSALSLGQNA
jgi:hypothetical protein